MALHATGARPSKRVDPGGYSTNELSAINCSPEETAIGRKFCHAVTRISVLSTLLGGGKTTNDFSSAFRLKRTKRHRTSIKRPRTTRKIGLSRRGAKLVVTYSSKWTDSLSLLTACVWRHLTSGKALPAYSP